ncbi:hypothetical protein Scep_030639 [Stephania cephalantha]|uniref:Uncharacterized protein n=1 Tax=Stephania cephalantha TaxID=152367 RepID=A0AAP0E373_9MAGN
MKDLLTLMNSPPYSEVYSFIIYCEFQVCLKLVVLLCFHCFNIYFPSMES